MRSPMSIKRTARAVVCLLAAMLLWLCPVSLTGCSGEIYDPSVGTLELVEGDSKGPLELPTEAPTGSVIQIPDTDPFENAPHVLRADFLNTGDSDAILLRMGSTVILVDTGEADDYGRISEKLNEYGLTTIHHLIITHFDNDHIGAMSQLLQNYEVGTVYMPDYVRDSSLYRRMMSALEVLPAVTVRRITEDVHLELDYGSLWINPTGLYEPGMTLGSDESHALEENNFSLITTVNFGDISLLLAGDAEQDRITEFMGLSTEEMAYDVIKIPHHGGYDKALAELLRRNTGLRYCMVHVGRGSPVEASLVTAMRASGAAAKYTRDGDIAFATDGVSMTVNQG